MASFDDFDLLPSLRETLAEQGMRVPTEIQARALPELLAGRSLIGVAETGSGKTLSYVLPVLHALKTLEDGGNPVAVERQPRALVIVPGRELGEQVAKVFKTFTHTTRLRVRAVLGGAKIEQAKRAVNGCVEVLVATPGRLRQLVDQDEVSLRDVRILVFDEADQMLDAGFLPDAVKIAAACESSNQTLLFSATLPAGLDGPIGPLFKSTPVQVRTRGSHRVVASLETVNRQVIGGRRWDLLLTVLAEPVEGGTLLFVNTREQVDKLAGQLTEIGKPFAVFRGEMDKQERRANLAKFRDGEVSLLIATDLGSRGLDVETVARVVNYHLPHQVENYLHRAGRTARAGRPGVVVNFITARDARLMEKLKR